MLPEGLLSSTRLFLKRLPAALGCAFAARGVPVPRGWSPDSTELCDPCTGQGAHVETCEAEGRAWGGPSRKAEDVQRGTSLADKTEDGK